MTKTIHDLPTELLFYIISKVDGCSLARASCVCLQWREIVFDLGKAFNIWYRRCLEEFGLDLVIAQTGLVLLATEKGRARVQSLCPRWEFWKDLYAANQRCKYVGSRGWKGEVFKVKQVGEGGKDMFVTAAAIHPCAHLRGGGRLYVGLKKGRVYYIDLDTAVVRRGNPDHSRSKRPMSSLLPIHSDPYIDYVNSIGIIALAADGCPGYSPENWEDKSIVISVAGASGRPLEICGTSLARNRNYRMKPCIQELSTSAMCISFLGSYFTAGDQNSLQKGIIVMQMFEENGKPQCRSVLRLDGPQHSDTSAIALDYNQVVASDSSGNLYSWCFSPLSSFDTIKESVSRSTHFISEHPENVHFSCYNQKGIVRIDEPTHHIKLPYGVSQIIIHQGQVLALTNPGEASIYVLKAEDWSKMWCISSAMLKELDINCCSEVQSLAAFGPLLAVGFRTGEVLVFNISSQDWMKNLSQSKVLHFRFPLHSLTTLRFTHDPEGPALIASGSHSYLCRWRKRREGEDESMDWTELTEMYASENAQRQNEVIEEEGLVLWIHF